MPNYDVNWQLTYELVCRAAKGAGLVTVDSHDGSENHPHNLVMPPIDVKWGPATSGEMSFTSFGCVLDLERLGVAPQVPAKTVGATNGPTGR